MTEESNIGIMLVVAGLFALTFYLLRGQIGVVGAVASNDEQVLARLWTAIGVPSRLQRIRTVSLTGKVVGVAPHYAPDGDMVFALKPDPPNDTLVNAANKAQAKMGGGLWVEPQCQRPNKSTEPWHRGDCARGGPFPIYPLPKLGDRLAITGTYVIDTREGGHAEIHGVSRMSRLT